MRVKPLLPTLAATWSAPNHVNALTTTRIGGLSNKPFDTLNLGQHVGDCPQNVEDNRRFVINELNLPNLPQWLNQEHTIEIQTDKQRFNNDPCDGMYTRQKGQVCVVMTADCMPLLITDKSGSEVAAVHAGWRGMADGIIEKAIDLFDAEPKDLLVWAGPTISQPNFEIGPEVKIALGGSDKYYIENSQRLGHYFCDLYGLAGERVKQLGASYSHSNVCTYANEKEYFSYRRDGKTGRMASFIWF